MAKFRKGQRVLYYGVWGNDKPKVVKIIGKDKKNGKVVYDCSGGHWGYSSQFKKIPKRKR